MNQIRIDASNDKQQNVNIELAWKNVPVVKLNLDNIDGKYDFIKKEHKKGSMVSVVYIGDTEVVEYSGKVQYSASGQNYRSAEMIFSVNCDACKYVFGTAAVREYKLTKVLDNG